MHAPAILVHSFLRACGVVAATAVTACANGNIDLFAEGLGTSGEAGGPVTTTEQDSSLEASARVPAFEAQGAPIQLDSAAGQSETGTAETCVVDTDCHDSSQAHCDERLKACVQCISDVHCLGQPESKCDRLTESCALPCGTSADCAAARLTCDTGQGVCVECLGDAQCAGQTPRCDTQQRVCVQCLFAMDCPAPAKCWQQVCVACVTNADCSESGACSASHECN
ncbi:MAG: hypothetical protein M3O36_18105 [Myxococcota bacterium]|nr:hypothetical protein [Myxococcota bacterium]